MNPSLKALFFILAILTPTAACAPRAIVKPIPANTTPDKVLHMALADEEAVKGLKASVRITYRSDTGEAGAMDAVLYAQRPDKARLTGLALMGFTVFDALVTGDKFYFYQPSDGIMYTGPRGAMRGFLEKMGVRADPEVIYRSLFTDGGGAGEGRLVERTADGWAIYLTRKSGDALAPVVRADYDAGLGLVGKTFYDELARPWMDVQYEGSVEEGGFTFPVRIKARDLRNGYTLTVDFEKRIVNPDGLDAEMTIQGGELKEIREVE